MSGCGCACLQQKVKEVALLDKPALMKKLRGLLSDLLGRVAGRNKDDVSEALIIVCFSNVLLS